MVKRLLLILLVCVGLLSGCGRVGEISTSEPPEPAITAEPEETAEPATPIEVSGQELIDIFQMAYDYNKKYELSFEDSFELELDYIERYISVVMPDKALPEDYSERYLDWRPLDTEQSQAEVTEISETVPSSSSSNGNTGTSISGPSDTSVDDLFTNPADIPPELGGGGEPIRGGYTAFENPQYTGSIGGSGAGSSDFDGIFTDPEDIPPHLGGGETVTGGVYYPFEGTPQYSGTIG